MYDTLENYAERELKYQFRRKIGEEIRKHCNENPDSDPMVTGITVMLGTVLAMTVFCAALGSGRGRRR